MPSSSYESGNPAVLALCQAYAQIMPSDQHFSHVTAAVLHGLPLPSRLRALTSLHVTVLVPGTPPRMRGIVAHEVDPERARVVRLGELRVADGVQAWCELSTQMGLNSLVALGDALVRRQHPLSTMTELRDAVDRHAGRRGAKRLRAALELVRPGVDSPAETFIRLLIVGAGLPEPRVNAVIRDRRGAFAALGDLVYPAQRVLIEYDGRHHFGSESQAHHDIDRLDRLMAMGWRVIRLNRTHLQREAVVLARVREALTSAG